MSALEELKSSTNKMEAAAVKGFLLQLKQFDVIFAFQFLGEILEYANTNSITLQKKACLWAQQLK